MAAAEGGGEATVIPSTVKASRERDNAVSQNFRARGRCVPVKEQAKANDHGEHFGGKVAHSVVRRSRRALETTERELRLMAAPATTGLSSQPKNGYSAPAAIGMPSEL